MQSPFTLEPLLVLMRDYYRLPRGLERFETYLKLAAGDAQRAADLPKPPLVYMNPMGKDHVLKALEAWIALDAEALVTATLQEAAKRLEYDLQALKVGLVIVDDLKGDWTNRYFNDAGFRFKLEGIRTMGWLAIPLWSSEAPSLELLRLEVLEGCARVAYFWERGEPKTLIEMMRQEGHVAAFAGRQTSLNSDDLEYTRIVLEPLLESTHQPTQMAALYGDAISVELGYPPLGISPRAGFELALFEELARIRSRLAWVAARCCHHLRAGRHTVT